MNSHYSEGEINPDISLLDLHRQFAYMREKEHINNLKDVTLLRNYCITYLFLYLSTLSTITELVSGGDRREILQRLEQRRF